ncbi:VOC family protein [Alienimonas californiensis]|uniref:Glyoxalase-like domain protein n=1 Tax=Alienimonas californiensis TaxID=2527989 RepID=A0A517P606_9PLAN|nr:VOC family protein [Alienimonas californiensis]QDT14811.1 Glyoxalase-like domain protein [Alienimonas californiensis]
MSREIFVNLPVADLERSKAFFTALGFRIDPRFTDETAAGVAFSDTIYAMLLTHKKFEEFAPRPIAGPDVTEAIVCLSCESREEVQDLIAKAVAAGGSTHREPTDAGWMYFHGFRDPDGHAWELMFMDQTAAAEHFGPAE